MAQFEYFVAVLVLFSSLAVLAGAVTAPKPSDWQLCDEHANYDIMVKNVSINPDPVVSGEEMTFVVPAYSEKEITGGSVVVSVSFHGITVHTEQSNICDKAQCPIAPGVFVLDNTQVLPGITPPGSYKIKLQFLGEEGEQLACANINFSIVWSLAELVERFQSLNPIKLYKKSIGEKAPVAHK